MSDSAEPVRRSTIVRRATLDPPRAVYDDPRPYAVVPPAVRALIVQRPTGRRARHNDGRFWLMFLDEDGHRLTAAWSATLREAVGKGQEIGAIRPEQWHDVSEPFGEVAAIGPRLAEQLAAVEPTYDASVENRPCRVRLRDGSWCDAVYLQEYESYLDQFGVAPGTDNRGREVEFADVVEISESRVRLRAQIAQALLAAGESAMGGCFFTLVTARGRRIPCQTGNFVDFIDYPVGVGPGDVVTVEAHAEDARLAERPVGTPPLRWCVYSLPD